MGYKICICGDVFPGNRALPFFIGQNIQAVWGDLLESFSRSDLRIANLECPLIQDGKATKKTGPVLGVPGEAVEGLKQSRFDVLGLANNHMMDYGVEGLSSTLSTLEQADIRHVGAGVNVAAANGLAIVEADGIKVGVAAMADHEFGIATHCRPGVNPLDVVRFSRLINERRHEVDYLIVLLHAGNEMYHYPSPSLRDLCRFMVECGSDAVIVQHTHCVGCYEEYQGKHIVYGQGNGVFDMGKKPQAWHEGLLVLLDVNSDFTSSVELVPYNQFQTKEGLAPLSPNRAEEFRHEFDERCAAVKDDERIYQLWDEYCHRNINSYLGLLYGLSRPLRVLDRKSIFSRYLHSKQARRTALNVVRCQAHRDVLVNALEQHLGYK